MLHLPLFVIIRSLLILPNNPSAIMTAHINQAALSERRSSTMLKLMLLIVSLTMLLSVRPFAFAQTEFQIQAQDHNLESEYKQELDKWTLRAYEGDPESQFKVGVLYTNDQFHKPDFEQAVYWYKQAARQGHVLSQYNLGHHYLTGSGVEKNEKLAIQWWLKAARQDHPLAQFNVGRAYYAGIGIAQDHTKSRYWFERAALNQESKSIAILAELGWDDKLPAQAQQVASAQQPKQIPDTTEPTLVSLITPKNSKAAAPTPVINKPKPSNKSAHSNKKTPAKSAKTSTAKHSPTKPVKPKKQVATPVAAAATKQPIKQSSAQANKNVSAVALFTNPRVRSVLITIFDNRDELKVVSRNKNWITVTSPTGLPVWMHGDYLQVSGNTAIVDGDDVNARSVPIISKGTVVGRLNRGVKVKVIDKQSNWFRVMSPANFKAWVKATDFNRKKNAPTTAQNGQWNFNKTVSD